MAAIAASKRCASGFGDILTSFSVDPLKLQQVGRGQRDIFGSLH